MIHPPLLGIAEPESNSTAPKSSSFDVFVGRAFGAHIAGSGLGQNSDPLVDGTKQELDGPRQEMWQVDEVDKGTDQGRKQENTLLGLGWAKCLAAV